MLELCCPCLFGLEGPLADELRRLKFADVSAENGRVRFRSDEYGVARSNIGLRMAERVLIELGSFDAESFDELFEGVRALPLEDFIPKSGAFPVKGHCLDSKLHSVPDCQRIIKKAAASRLGSAYGVERLPEDGELFQMQFSIMKDRAVIYLDTSGAGLHKRGYRPEGGAAPLRETLAAAMVTLARYRGKGDFCDPFCGSGTIAIEAAFIAKNRAPGLLRSFSAEKWPLLGKSGWERARAEARGAEFDGDYHIFASDVDPAVLETARKSAKRAEVFDLINFEEADAGRFSRETDRGVIVTNPPYGERLMEKKDAEALYRAFGSQALRLSGWDMYILSSHTEFERCFGRRADKKRKLYNGMIKCELFMYGTRRGGEKSGRGSAGLDA